MYFLPEDPNSLLGYLAPMWTANHQDTWPMDAYWTNFIKSAIQSIVAGS